MSSNLPPGCRVSDIPGNRPADIEADQVGDKLAATITAAWRDTLHMNEDDMASVLEALAEEVRAATPDSTDGGLLPMRPDVQAEKEAEKAAERAYRASQR